MIVQMFDSLKILPPGCGSCFSYIIISATDKQRICVKTQLKLSNTQLISNQCVTKRIKFLGYSAYHIIMSKTKPNSINIDFFLRQEISYTFIAYTFRISQPVVVVLVT